MLSHANSPQSKPSLIEIQSRVFLESMQSLRDSKMDDDTFDDDFVFEDEEDHRISQLNILQGSGCASGRMSKLIDLQASPEIEDDSDEGEDKLRRSLDSDSSMKRPANKRQQGYERLPQSNKLDKVMEKIQFEEKLQAKYDREYYKQVSQQCSKKTYELFDIPERSESQFLGYSPKMISNINFQFN